MSTFIYSKQIVEWQLFTHVAIDHQPLIALEQWKVSRHRLLWVAVVNRNVGKRYALKFSPNCWHQTRSLITNPVLSVSAINLFCYQSCVHN